MKKTRIVSAILALAMIFTTIIPVAVNAADADGDGYDVVIHKIKLDSLEGWPKTDASKYHGNMIDNIQDYFGENAKPLEGVYFTIYQLENKDLYDQFVGKPDSYKTKDQVENVQGVTVIKEDVGPTDKEGKATITGLKKGYYWIIEQNKTLPGGENLLGSAAIPMGLELPVYKADGSTFTTGNNALHVYPKNTITETPTMEKTIDGEGSQTERPVETGQSVPFTITTTIPENAAYRTAVWTDQLTEGLDFNNDIIVLLDGKALQVETDYTVSTVGNSFKVALTKIGLEKLNGKPQQQIQIKYSAKVNELAYADDPESNDVLFHYGNNPNHGNTPIPTKPNNGQITATKKWDGAVPEGAQITLTIYNAQTNQPVDFKDGQSKSQTITKENDTVTWTGLDNSIEYKVEETHYEGYSAEYTTDNNGIITITNHKDDNPPPINPEQPSVVLGGKKFVKVDGTTKEVLSGAEFIISKTIGTETFYLTEVSADKVAEREKAYNEAQKAYLDAVAAVEGEPTTEQAQDIEAKKAARDQAFEAYRIRKWDWTADKDAAYKITSGEDGKFEIHGLKYGEYKLIETKAPKDYALLTSEINFTIEKGSYSDAEDKIFTIENNKISIPQTGGMGTVIFIIAGLAIMGTAIVVMKRRQELEI